MAREIAWERDVESAKSMARALYLLHGLSFLFSLGAFSFIPLIFNYAKRNGAAGTFIYSHHTWMIRSFWWYLVWAFVGFALFMTIILIPLAWLVWLAAWLWKAYRLMSGFLALNDHKPMPV